jgi:ubiquinone/menaquinone biosynthesis C-methylase UbiE
MLVLEIGPGSGTYTLAAARRVGKEGQVVAVDIAPKIIDHLKRRISHEVIPNIELSVADAQALPFLTQSFDLIYMISVIGEIPDKPQALREFHRVLKPEGSLAFSELLPDPDYPLASHLVRLVESQAFHLKERKGKLFYYTLIFRKESFLSNSSKRDVIPAT